MNVDLLVIGALLLILGYVIGIKKMTWLLTGFNEKRVSDKKKLSFIVGGFNGIMSMIFLAAGLSSLQQTKYILALLLIGYLALIVYVNVKMVD